MCKKEVSCLLIGASGSGKTCLLRKLLTGKRPIAWCYGASKPDFKLRRAVYIKGTPRYDDIKGGTDLVLDDLLTDVDTEITKFFICGRSHKCLNVYLLAQNLFDKKLRTISLNCSIIYLFKNVRDRAQVKTLGRQIFPENLNYFLEAYNAATARPYGYLKIDLRPETEDSLRLSSVNDEEKEVYYIEEVLPERLEGEKNIQRVQENSEG